MLDVQHYSFDRYSVDIFQKVISKDGELLCRDTRQVILLYLLCKAYPNALTKEEIMKGIWPGQVVTEASISRLISDLRQTIGDDGKQQSFIKTEWGKGFRMTCRVIPRSSSASLTLLKSLTSIADRFSITVKIGTGMILSGSLLLFIWLSSSNGNLSNSDHSKISLAIAPVNILTSDPADEWISLGVPSLISGYLQNYKNIESISIKQVLNFLEDAKIDKSKIASRESFTEICNVLACTHLLYLEYKTTAAGHSLAYQLISGNEISSIHDFNYIDVTVAAEYVTNQVSDRLLPRNEQRKSYAEFYSQDALANRSYAIASNDRLRGNLNEAEANFKLALQRDENFFWAGWGLATVYYRKNEWKRALDLLSELEENAEGDPKKLGAIYQTWGSIEEAKGNIRYAIELERKAIAFYEQAGNVRGIANVKHNIGMALFNSGDTETGLSYLMESLNFDLEKGEKTNIAISSYNVGRVYAALNQTEKARELFNQAREYAYASKMALLAVYARAALADLNMYSGITSDRLVIELNSIIEEFKKLGHSRGALEARGCLITLLRLRGQLDEAEAAIAAHIAEIDAEKHLMVINKARYIAAEIYYDLSKFDEALEQLAKVNGEWSEVKPERSLLKAKIVHAMGDSQKSIEIALQVKQNLGKSWGPEHQLILENLQKDTVAISP